MQHRITEVRQASQKNAKQDPAGQHANAIVPYCSQFPCSWGVDTHSPGDANSLTIHSCPALQDRHLRSALFKPIRAPGHVCGIAKHWQGSRFNYADRTTLFSTSPVFFWKHFHRTIMNHMLKHQHPKTKAFQTIDFWNTLCSWQTRLRVPSVGPIFARAKTGGKTRPN